MKNLDRFTEAKLTGIQVMGDPRTLTLTLIDTAGILFSWEAHGVHRLIVSEFRESNIVDNLTIWDSNSDPSIYRDALMVLVNGKLSQSKNLDQERIIAKEIDSIVSGRHIFAELEAVYGAQILVIAKEIL